MCCLSVMTEQTDCSTAGHRPHSKRSNPANKTPATRNTYTLMHMVADTWDSPWLRLLFESSLAPFTSSLAIRLCYHSLLITAWSSGSNPRLEGKYSSHAAVMPDSNDDIDETMKNVFFFFFLPWWWKLITIDFWGDIHKTHCLLSGLITALVLLMLTFETMFHITWRRSLGKCLQTSARIFKKWTSADLTQHRSWVYYWHTHTSMFRFLEKGNFKSSAHPHTLAEHIGRPQADRLNPNPSYREATEQTYKMVQYFDKSQSWLILSKNI